MIKLDSVGSDSNVSYFKTPKNPAFFKKRLCIRFVKDPKTSVCAGCKRAAYEHQFASDSGVTKWTYETCTTAVPTDAYGRLHFPGSHSKTAEYIRVQNETSAQDMIHFMYHPSGWNLRPPQLILSVTGGAQKFTVSYRMKKAFKRGLIKAAATTGAWITTGGTNAGVMRMVGEAVAEESHKYSTDITCIGIATWGKIELREKMIVTENFAANSLISNIVDKRNDPKRQQPKQLFYAKKGVMVIGSGSISDAKESNAASKKQLAHSNPDVLLDSNHTHFILVDDGSQDTFGKEIEFRARLEVELRRGKTRDIYKSQRSSRKHRRIMPQTQPAGTEATYDVAPSVESVQANDDGKYTKPMVPMVLIVVQGGPNTLLTVEKSLKQSAPVLILADSKGCADLIAKACLIKDPDEPTLIALLEESKMFERLKGKPSYQTEMNDALQVCQFIISKYKDNLINIFKLDSDEGSQDIELAILRAFLNSRHTQYFENLKLALQWNRHDIAKSDIFTGEEEFESYQLVTLMEMALVQNKPHFVELLLENGLNLKTFLNTRRLVYLYNAKKLRQSEQKAPIYKIFKKKFWAEKHELTITFKGLRNFLCSILFDEFDEAFLPEDLDLKETKDFLAAADKIESSICLTNEDKYGRTSVNYPEKNLFVWALLMNRMEMAKVFWQIGEYQIGTALFAFKLLNEMSNEDRLLDLKDKLANDAKDYEQKACGVMSLIDSRSDDSINAVILLQKIPYYNIETIIIAEKAECLKFVALSSVQNLLTSIWNRSTTKSSGLGADLGFILSCASLGLLAPFVMIDKKNKHQLIATGLQNNFNARATLKHLLAAVSHLENYLLTEKELKESSGNLLSHLCLCCRSTSNELGYTMRHRIGDDDEDDDNGDDDDDDEDDEISSQDSDDNDVNDLKDYYDEAVNNSPVKSMCVNMDPAENVYFHDDVVAPDAAPPPHPAVSQQRECASGLRAFFRLYWIKYHRFVNSPRVRFVYDASCFTIFLAMFSYMLLCEFNYYEKAANAASSVDVGNSTYSNANLSVSATVQSHLMPQSAKHRRKVANPSVIEYLIIFWIFSFAVEEIYQFFFSNSTRKRINQLKAYFDNNWNYLDVTGITLFWIGLALRLISIWTSELVFIAARLLYALDLTIWYVRLLHVSIVFKSLGPKLVMIQKMMYDLIFFIIIIAIFVCCFGVTTQATLYPGNELGMKLIKDLVNKGYWPIYGDMKILGEIEEREAACLIDSRRTCPEYTGTIFSYVALMVYMIVANVLLINLLIAMFSSTFQNVQDNTDEIWMSQRYRLVFEFHDSSVFPPPLNFVPYFVQFVGFVYHKLCAPKRTGIKEKLEDLLVERKFAEEYLRNEQKELIEKTESRLKSNVEKLESLEQKLNKVINSKSFDQTRQDASHKKN